MNTQELFDTVVAHLRKQGERAARGTDCLYLAPDGKRCAVGALVPIAKERGLTEYVADCVDVFTGDVYDVLTEYPSFGEALGFDEPETEYEDGDSWSIWPKEVQLLKDLQMLHDNERNWNRLDGGFNHEGENELARIAERYHLDITAGATT